MDICLVTMPYSRIELSSVALGLLQAVLERDGRTAGSFYANMLFGEEIGFVAYNRIARYRPRLALADWTFAHIAFPEFTPDDSKYFDLVVELLAVYRKADRQELQQTLTAVRGAATRFVEDIAHRILDKKPKMVGCSSTFSQHVPSLGLLRRIRELAPDVVTLLGGANCETVMGRTTHKCFPWVDFVVSGEADGLISPLVRQILEHGRDVPPELLHEGVFIPVHRQCGYPAREGCGSDDAPRATSLNLEGHPPPNFDDFFDTLNSLPHLHRAVEPGLTVETSRGCWWGQRKSCMFCGFNGLGKGFRSKSSAQVIDEFRTLHLRYGVNRIETVDNILDMRFFKTVFPELKAAGSPYSLYYEIKSNLRRIHIKTMREAGVIWVQTGIESLHTRALELMNKGCRAWHNIQLLKWCREFGVRVHWNLLYDFPNEQDEWYDEMAQLMPLLTHLQPPLKIVPLEFCRYSQYHERAEELGLNLSPARPYSYVYPVSAEDMRDLVYFFEEEGRSSIERNPIFALLMERPGLRRLHKEFNAWLKCFLASARPILTMKISPDRLVITDTRPSSLEHSAVLEGLCRDVYLACDEAPQSQKLFETFEKQGVSSDALEAVVQRLLDTRLMIALDGRYLSLAVREPYREMPADSDYPGGTIDEAEHPVMQGLPAVRW
jgi:ribosomal peptide maturation radical SAM protein 1